MKFLEHGLLQLKADVTSPEAAIRCAGGLLVANGLVDERYIDAMIASYHTNGAYFVIAPHIAIPHARPEDGARESGVSFVPLAHPIAFGSSANDPVDLVFGLAAHSGSEHLKLIQRIVALLNDARCVEALRAMDNPIEMESLIKGVRA